MAMTKRRPSLDFWLWIVVLSAMVIAASVYLTFPEKVAPPVKRSKIEGLTQPAEVATKATEPDPGLRV